MSGEPPTLLRINWTIGLTVAEMDAHEVMQAGGLYLWIQNGKVTYIGEARCFQDRFAEHFKAMVGGSYTAWQFHDDEDPYQAMALSGPGLDPRNDRISWASAWDVEGAKWNLIRIVDLERIGKIRGVIDKTTFMFGVCDELTKQPKLRKEIEGGLIDHLCRKHGLWRGRSTVLGNINRYPRDSYEIVHEGDGGDEAAKLLSCSKRMVIKLP
jgi:hypothetical protein